MTVSEKRFLAGAQRVAKQMTRGRFIRLANALRLTKDELAATVGMTKARRERAFLEGFTSAEAMVFISLEIWVRTNYLGEKVPPEEHPMDQILNSLPTGFIVPNA